MYIKGSRTERDFVAAGFWVDNYVAISSRKELTALAESVNAKYGITSLGEVRWVLGMLLERDRPARTISILQEAFIDSILTRFNLTVLSRRPSPRELPFPQTTVLPRRTELGRWRIGHIGSLWELLRGSHSELARTLRSPVRSPVLGTTPVTSIGMWPNEYYTTSRAPNSGISRWEASPRRSPTSQMLIGEVTATTDAQSERIPSRSEMESSA